MFEAVNDYTLLKLLGKGEFGEVNLAESIEKEKYALKIIPVTKENKAEAKTEAEMYVAFTHPNVLKAREFFFKKEEYLVIVLEYCQDGNLGNFMGKLDQKECKEIMTQLAEGLVYLHDQKKTLHRDLKLENILMLNGIPKIADLGISKIMETSGLTTKIGTLFYASPEVLNEENYDFSVDVWSLGIVFLELLLGKRINQLVEGVNPPSLREDFPFDQLLDQIEDQSLRGLVKKMLEKDSQKRLKAKEVLEELKGNNINAPKENAKVDQRYQFGKMSENQFIELLLEDAQFPKLTDFQLDDCQLTDKALFTLASIPSLQTMLPKLQAIYFNKNKITDEGLKALVGAGDHFAKLQVICLHNNHITCEGFKTMAAAGQFKNLQFLGLKNNKITDEGLKALTSMDCMLKNLKYIYLDNNQIADEGLKALAGAADKIKYLKEIHLSNNQITDNGLKALAGVAGELKDLQRVYFDSNLITDEGLKALASAADQLTNLKVISLQHNKITDEGLKALVSVAGGKLSNLQAIYLRNTNVTLQAVNAVKKQYLIKFSIIY